MRKYIIITIGILGFLGCSDDYLDVTNPNSFTADEFWRNADDANKGIIGVYSPIASTFWNGRIFTGYQLAMSDALWTRSDFAKETSLFNHNPGDFFLATGWGTMWQVVFRSNLVLENVPNIDMDTNLKNSILGEAYFLRAYAYFTLINYWMEVPLVTESAETAFDVLAPKSTREAVWAQIKSDLTAAIPLLPNTWDDDNKGRATAGAAAALLGKSHLYQEEWSDAATQLKRVIDGEFAAYDLVPNYEDNFRASGDNNIESLFEVQFDLAGGFDWNTDTNTPSRFNNFAPDFASRGLSFMNRWVLDLFLKETTNGGEIDPRAYETMVWDYPGATHWEEDFATHTLGSGWTSQPDTLIRTAKYVTPDKIPSGVPPSFGESDVNKKIIRFADVLLMYAEAENEANGPAAAYASINSVRARADMPNIPAGLTQEEFRQRVRDERVLELILEGDRGLDLLRWGLYPSRILENPWFRSDLLQYQPGREYLPIPQTEVDTNPNIDQNQGYQ